MRAMSRLTTFGAGNEQQERRCAEQHQQRRAHLAHELFVQRNDLGVDHPRLVAVLLFEPARHALTSGLACSSVTPSFSRAIARHPPDVRLRFEDLGSCGIQRSLPAG